MTDPETPWHWIAGGVMSLFGLLLGFVRSADARRLDAMERDNAELWRQFNEAQKSDRDRWDKFWERFDERLVAFENSVISRLRHPGAGE